MHTKAVRHFSEKFTIITLMLGFAIGRFDLFIKNILIDNEDRKKALLRGRMFAMWHFTVDGSEEGGDVFLTCGSAEWGCKELNAPEGAALHCLQEMWERNNLMHNEEPSNFLLFPYCDGWKHLPWAPEFLFFMGPDCCLVSHYSA